MTILIRLLLIFAAAASVVHAEDAPKMDDDMALLNGIAGRGGMRSFSRTGIAPGVSYTGWWAPNGNSGESNYNALSATTLVYKSERDAISLYTSASDFHIAAPPVLPNGVQVPGDLGRMEVGGGYATKINEKSSWGAGLGFGSASDSPLSSSRVDTYSANGFYSYSTSEHSTWVGTLLYSNNNPISNSLPIPGFMYIYRSQDLVLMVGFPFASAIWRPVDPWVFTASIFGPTVNLEAAYGHRSNLQSFVGFRTTEQSYLRADRDDYYDRLREVEKRAYAGVRFPIAHELFAEFQGGYAFDRFVGEGGTYHYFSPSASLDNSANLGNSFFLATNLRLGF